MPLGDQTAPGGVGALLSGHDDLRPIVVDTHQLLAVPDLELVFRNELRERDRSSLLDHPHAPETSSLGGYRDGQATDGPTDNDQVVLGPIARRRITPLLSFPVGHHYPFLCPHVDLTVGEMFR